jgi:hypothetical protein
VSPPGALWRPLGFFLLVVGLGLRLDTTWQGLAWVCMLVGTLAGGAGLWELVRRSSRGAFVPRPGEE